MNNVCIAVPTQSGNIYFELALRLIQWSSQKTIPVEIMFQPFSSPVDHARNDIVRRFLLTKCTHLLMIDDDIVPPYETLERLLFHDKEIVAAVCPLIGPDNTGRLVTTLNVFSKQQNGMYIPWLDASPSIHEVDAAGTGCIMIRREVLTSMQAPFMTLYEDTGLKWQGEDINFCEEAKNLGAQIFADFKLKCKHIKACNLLEIYDQTK